MSTTIQISDQTKRILKKMKGNRTYEEIIQELINNQNKVKTSGFGMIPGLKWSKEDRMQFKHE